MKRIIITSTSPYKQAANIYKYTQITKIKTIHLLKNISKTFCHFLSSIHRHFPECFYVELSRFLKRVWARVLLLRVFAVVSFVILFIYFSPSTVDDKEEKRREIPFQNPTSQHPIHFHSSSTLDLNEFLPCRTAKNKTQTLKTNIKGYTCKEKIGKYFLCNLECLNVKFSNKLHSLTKSRKVDVPTTNISLTYILLAIACWLALPGFTIT